MKTIKKQLILIIAVAFIAIAICGTTSATQTTIVTTGATGTGGNGVSTNPSVSGDGNYIVFSSSATDLIPGIITNGNANIYLYNRATGSTNLVTTGATGTGGNHGSDNPSVSDDGNYIAFDSRANDLIPGITTNGYANVFLYNRATGDISLVTKGSTGTGGIGSSENPSFSGDGKYLAFSSSATDLIPGTTTNANLNVFLYNRITGSTKLVTTGATGTGGNNHSQEPSVSYDGNYITFVSVATNLIPGIATNGKRNVFLYNSITGTTSLVTTGSTGTGGNHDCGNPSVSYDGNYIALVSYATDLIPGTITNGNGNIFLYNRITGSTSLVTTGATGTGGNNPSYHDSISGNGNYIAFVSKASNLIPGTTTNGHANVFLYNRITGTTSLVTMGATGIGGNHDCGNPSVSYDGNYIALVSYATDLIPGTTTNGNANVFLYNQKSITINQLEAAALYVKTYYEAHSSTLPSNVKINGQTITMPQFLQLLVTGTRNINNSNLNPIDVTNVNNPTSPSGSYILGNLLKSEYLNVASNIKNFISTNNRAPNYAQTSIGKISFNKLVYIYSKVVNFYGINSRLPNYVTI